MRDEIPWMCSQVVKIIKNAAVQFEMYMAHNMRAEVQEKRMEPFSLKCTWHTTCGMKFKKKNEGILLLGERWRMYTMHTYHD